VKILNRWTNACIYESDHTTERETVIAAVAAGAYLDGAYLKGAYLKGAYLKGAYLEGAYLEGAYLDGAYLDGAYLKGAYLKGAYLKGAYLEGAYLKGAYLEGAYLEGAYLEGAYLDGAYLDGAYLKGAYLKGAYLEGAYLEGAIVAGCALGVPTFAAYLSEVVPPLLRAGGLTLRAILDAGAWECNDWANCPMAVAFSVHSLDDIPALHRPRAQQFVSLFDAGLIPRSVVEDAIALESSEPAE